MNHFRTIALGVIAIAGVLATGLATGLANAQGRAKEVKLTIEQSMGMLDALQNRMETFEKVDKDGKVGKGFYTFDIDTKLAMARNIVVLKWVQESYERARNGIVNELSGASGQVKQDTPEFFKLQVLHRELLSKEQPLNLFFLTRQQLKFGDKDNPIPVGVLTNILPIIED